MNVCILAHLFPARSETFIREHATGLRRRGHQVTVVARSQDPAVPATETIELDAMGITRVYLGELQSPKLNYLRSLIMGMRFSRGRPHFRNATHEKRRQWLTAAAECMTIRRPDPEVIHIHYGDHASRLFQMSGDLVNSSRCVVTWHGYDINAKRVVSDHEDYGQLLSLDLQHSVGSEFVGRKLEQLGARKSSVSVIPMGIDLCRFTYRSRQFRSGDALRLFSVGRLEEVKGHHVLVAAVAQLIDQGLSLSLRIAGGGRLRDALQRQIAECNVQENVTLLGPVSSDAIIDEMHAAHVFALTGVEEQSGKVESQGVVYAEAQATGLPVIGSALGGVPEVLLDGRTGWLCAPGDVVAVSDAIRSFVDNPQLIETYGVAGRRFVEEVFSIEHMIDRFEELYRHGN